LTRRIDILIVCDGDLSTWIVSSQLKAPRVMIATRLAKDRVRCGDVPDLCSRAIPTSLPIRCHVRFALGRSYNPKPNPREVTLITIFTTNLVICVCQTVERTERFVCSSDDKESVCLLGSKVSNEPDSPFAYCLVTTLRLLFDFVTDKVIVYIIRERRLSRTRAHQ